MKKYKVIGIMSGTSMDGVDIAYCEFWQIDQHWKFEIKHAETIAYNNTWIVRLSALHKQPIHLLPKTDAYYGKYLGQLVNNFIKKYSLQVDFIASHGHTIFHQPQNGFTTQIGCGANLYAETGIKTINNFRVVDVAFGGQGAPLVPIGDELLFNQHDACLNLGGFSNISFTINQSRKAFDIGPCNIVTNQVAQQLGFDFDDGGKLANQGKVNAILLKELNNLHYYKINPPKSLGIEWVNTVFWPTVNSYQITGIDLLATFEQHIAIQIAETINANKLTHVLVTGGGAFNTSLINQINKLTKQALTIPDELLVNYKEALIFAFLGILRVEGNVNALKSVTGATQNNMGGAIWG